MGWALLSYSWSSLDPAIVFSSFAICSQSIFVSIPGVCLRLSFWWPFMKVSLVLCTSKVACYCITLPVPVFELKSLLPILTVLLFLVVRFLLDLLTMGALPWEGSCWPVALLLYCYMRFTADFFIELDFCFTGCRFFWLDCCKRSN